MSANHSLQKLLDELGRLPGIGPKSAQRIAYYLLEADAEEARRLAEAILEVKQDVPFCSRCFNYATADECSICQDSMRDTTRICVVGEPRDVQAIERTGSYHGLYHVLGGVISPMDKIGPEQLHIRELLARLGHEDITEVIIATNPNIEGETTASYLARTIKPLGVEVSRLASGLPVGGDLEYADELTLGHRGPSHDLGGEPAPAVCLHRDARGSHNSPCDYKFVVQQRYFVSAYRMDASIRILNLLIRCATFWVR
mgnify:CR=1 FL=1